MAYVKATYLVVLGGVRVVILDYACVDKAIKLGQSLRLCQLLRILVSLRRGEAHPEWISQTYLMPPARKDLHYGKTAVAFNNWWYRALVNPKISHRVWTR